MQNFSYSLQEMAASFWRNKSLILALAARDIQGRYRGSVIGLLWPFIQPMVMLGIYTFVFSVVFEARWNLSQNSKLEFALILFVGLLIFSFFTECISRAPSLIISQPNYVKKIIFPLEILPWVSLTSALFHVTISFIVWLVFAVFILGIPPITMFFLPVVFLPLIGMTLGLSWFLASLGTFIRDIGQMISMAMTILMFLSPIFYPASAIPEKYRLFIHLNPLTPIIEGMRSILIDGTYPRGDELLISWSLAFVIMWFGFIWFQKTRKGFADVL